MIDHLRAIRDDEVLRKRLAKLMAQRCFRNTRVEDLHAGTVPDTRAGDYSDVKVVSPFGEIPWPRLSRLSDDEMQELMIDVIDQCYTFLTDLLAHPEGSQMIERIREAHCRDGTSPCCGRLVGPTGIARGDRGTTASGSVPRRDESWLLGVPIVSGRSCG